MIVRNNESRMALPKRCFDCRRYIKAGDKIKYYVDQKDIDTLQGVGIAVAMYEKFVLIKCKHIVTSVNRWDIKAVNGTPVANGCFADLIEVR